MSYTEIYKFKNNGEAELHTEIKNSWLGAMAVWIFLDKKYLPPYTPEWAILSKQTDKTYSRASDPHAIKDVWKLFYDDKVTLVDKIVLGTTFDHMIVKREDFQLVIDAFNSFEGNTSLKLQSEVIKELIDDPDCLGIAWNQTSVSESFWDNERTYNILINDEHFNLFDEPQLKKNNNL